MTAHISGSILILIFLKPVWIGFRSFQGFYILFNFIGKPLSEELSELGIEDIPLFITQMIILSCLI
jgi:hypothetical protein